VTDALLLDTHIALWLDSGSELLRPSTRVLIDQCRHGGGSLLQSSVSAWEIAQACQCATD
jgi:PIN domain nuclease of toxin-antitoxin system